MRRLREEIYYERIAKRVTDCLKKSMPPGYALQADEQAAFDHTLGSLEVFHQLVVAVGLAAMYDGLLALEQGRKRKRSGAYGSTKACRQESSLARAASS